MIRGTTPTHIFQTGADLSEAAVVYVTYAQNGKTVIEKSLEDGLTVEGSKITMKMTQADTLSLSPNYQVYIQIRARFEDGSAYATKKIKRDVEDILKDGEI